VEESARLYWAPRPTVSAVGSDLRQSVRVDLAPTARLLLSEQQILGRAHEPPGRLTSRLTVRRDGHTVLDQETSYGPGAPGWSGPAVLAGHRATGQILVIDPALESGLPQSVLLDDPASGGHGVVVPLPCHGGLLTAVAPDAGGLRRLLTSALRLLGLEDHDDLLVPD
jgi:urease accessory protein